MLTFATMAVSSSSAGVLVDTKGWEIVNYAAIPFVTIALVAAIWLAAPGARQVVATQQLFCVKVIS